MSLICLGNNPFSNSGAINGGVFGKTGSGKTTAAGFMIGGWLKNRDMKDKNIRLTIENTADDVEELKELWDEELLGNSPYSKPVVEEPKVEEPIIKNDEPELE